MFSVTFLSGFCSQTITGVGHSKVLRNETSSSCGLDKRDYLVVIRDRGGQPGPADRVLALHAGSRGFDSHREHMSERFFRSNRPGYPHRVSSELEISGIRVAVGDCSVTERRR